MSGKKKVPAYDCFDHKCKIQGCTNDADGRGCENEESNKGYCKYGEICTEHSEKYISNDCQECGEDGRGYCTGLDDCDHNPSVGSCMDCKTSRICVNCSYDDDGWLCGTCSENRKLEKIEKLKKEMEKDRCSVVFADGKRCKRDAISNGGCCWEDNTGSKCVFWNMCKDCTTKYTVADCDTCGESIEGKYAPRYCEFENSNHDKLIGTCGVCKYTRICYNSNCGKPGEWLCSGCAGSDGSGSDDTEIECSQNKRPKTHVDENAYVKENA